MFPKNRIQMKLPSVQLNRNRQRCTRRSVSVECGSACGPVSAGYLHLCLNTVSIQMCGNVLSAPHTSTQFGGFRVQVKIRFRVRCLVVMVRRMYYSDTVCGLTNIETPVYVLWLHVPVMTALLGGIPERSRQIWKITEDWTRNVPSEVISLHYEWLWICVHSNKTWIETLWRRRSVRWWSETVVLDSNWQESLPVWS